MEATLKPYVNFTDFDGLYNGTYNAPRPHSSWTFVFAVFYALICIAGLVGNGLVIFVVLRYAKMKTVTNMYILNLAISDLCFLIGLPFLIVTSIVKKWIFGFFLCKIFYILTSINWFTSVFTLIVMSADRYLAVCHPIRSMSYRTPIVSRVVCVCVWLSSMLVMLPIILYTRLIRNSCTLVWPQSDSVSGMKAFTWYALLLGFAIPCGLISVFYTLVVMRLRTVGPKNKSKEKKKSHRRVTKMVLTVIAVYIICWLPYWLYQVTLISMENPPSYFLLMSQIITVMSYANSMLNPLLYAFFSENFRKTFLKAFSCASPADVNRALQAENSLYPGGRRSIACGVACGEAPLTTDKGLTTIESSNAKTKLSTLDISNEEEEDEKPQSESELQPVMQGHNEYEERCIEANPKDMDGLNSRPTAV